MRVKSSAPVRFSKGVSVDVAAERVLMEVLASSQSQPNLLLTVPARRLLVIAVRQRLQTLVAEAGGGRAATRRSLRLAQRILGIMPRENQIPNRRHESFSLALLEPRSSPCPLAEGR